MSHGDPAKPFLQALTESKLEDETALKFLAAVERFCKQKRFVLPIEFPADHPVEKVGRMLMACLLKHQELGKFLITKVDGPGNVHTAPKKCENVALHVFLQLGLPSTLILPSTTIRHEKRSFISMVRPTVHTNPSRKRSFISTVRPTVHTNPSRQQSFSKTLFKPGEFENAGFVFSCRAKIF